MCCLCVCVSAFPLVSVFKCATGSVEQITCALFWGRGEELRMEHSELQSNCFSCRDTLGILG